MSPHLTVGDGDAALDERLSKELDAHNFAAVGRDDLRGLTVRAEDVARRRGCRQLLVSSFTFQAPDFYRRHGYTEFARSPAVPVEGEADVHFVKTL